MRCPLQSLGGSAAVPARLVCRALPTSHRGVDVTTGLLLPSGDSSDPGILGQGAADEAAGLFLASPLVQADRLADALLRAGFGWACNLPTVAQHETGFTGFLDDVAMGLGRERAILSRLRERGLRVLHAVAGRSKPTAFADAILLVPTVEGSPLPIGELERCGWNGPVLALAQPEMP